MRNYVKLKRAIALCAAIAALLALYAPAYAVDYEELREGVFRITALNADGIPLSFGTGFAVGVSGPVQYIITNQHVLEPTDAQSNPLAVEGIYIVENNDNALVRCTVLKSLKDIDVAILKTDRTIDRKPMLLGTEDLVKATDDVYAYGFPTGDVSTQQLSEPQNVSISKGIVNKKTEKDGVDYYQHDATINKGNSGGPLVHRDGFVIGINAGTVQGSVNVNASIMIDQVLPVLDELNIEYLMYAPIDGLSSTPSAIPSQLPEDTPPAAESSGSAGGTAFWLVVFVFAGIAFLGVLGYLAWQYFLQKKQIEQSDEEDWAGQPILRGLSGQYAGTIIPLEGSVSIGRDPGACQIVFPRDMPGISRVHCQIRYDERAGVFVLKDLSTEGTIAAGKPVGRGRSVSLRPGERFYLVDEENGFIAEVSER